MSSRASRAVLSASTPVERIRAAAAASEAIRVAMEHCAWALRPERAGGGGLTRGEIAKGIGRAVPPGVEPEPTTVVQWLAIAWLEAVQRARRNVTRNAVTRRHAVTERA